MKKIKTVLLIIALFFFFCQEFPDKPVRDNPLDYNSDDFDISIINPVQDSTISSIFSIKIESKYASTQRNLESLEIFFNDSLLATGSTLPFTYKQNAELFPRGYVTIKCVAKSFDGRMIIKEISVFNRPLEVSISGDNELALDWYFGVPLEKTEIYRSRNKDMSDSILVYSETSESGNLFKESFITYGNLYYQVIARTKGGKIIRSNKGQFVGEIVHTATFAYDLWVHDIEVNSDGYIILVDEQGLYVYNSSYEYCCCSSERTQMNDCTISIDGTIFTADIYNGLSAFIFDKSSLVRTATLANDSYNQVVVCDGNNIVFLGNSDGLWAYEYTGTSFNLIAHINDAIVGVDAISLGPDGIIFTANGYMGINAYQFDGTSFTNIAHDSDIETSRILYHDGNIFLINNGSLWIYEWNGSSFIKIAQTYTNGRPNDVVIDRNNNIFVPYSQIGLNIFTLTNNTFQKIADFNFNSEYDYLYLSNLAVSDDGNIYFSNSKWYVLAYTHTWKVLQD